MSGPTFSSSGQFALDEGQSLAAIATMMNLRAFRRDLSDAAVWVNRGCEATELIALLELEDISDYTHCEISDPSGIEFTIAVLEQVATCYIQAIAELKECDVKSALTFIMDDFNGPPLSLGDKVAIGLAGFALVIAVLSPIPGDETLAAGFLSTLGVAASGVDVLFATGDYFFGDGDTSTFMFMINILSSAIPMLPGLGSIGKVANLRIATATGEGLGDAMISSVILNRLDKLNKINGLRGLPAMELMNHPDMVLDLSAALGITAEQVRELVASAALQAQEYHDILKGLHLNVDNGGRGAVPPPVFPELPESHTEEYRLHSYLVHQGLSRDEASKWIAEWKSEDSYLRQYDFGMKHPDIILPKDLSEIRAAMLRKEGKYAN